MGSSRAKEMQALSDGVSNGISRFNDDERKGGCEDLERRLVVDSVFKQLSPPCEDRLFPHLSEKQYV